MLYHLQYHEVNHIADVTPVKRGVFHIQYSRHLGDKYNTDKRHLTYLLWL